jgi:hypothetical protein
MKLQLWRNATLELNIDGISVLIDPMLGEKGSLGKFPMTDNELLNPLTDLPFGEEELISKLAKTDAVAVTHLHPDHWDTKAIQLIDKRKPILCPEIIADQIIQQGFENVIPINNHIQWKGIDIFLTQGRHGVGEIGEKWGQSMDLFLEKTINLYILQETVSGIQGLQRRSIIINHNIVVAGGAAKFSVGEPIIMTSEDIIKVCEYAPDASVWVTHLETVSHCREDRKFIQQKN